MKDVMKVVVFGGLFAVPFLTWLVSNDYFFPFITGKNFWFRIIVDITVAAWVILACYEVKYRPRISGITWSFGALLIVMFFANLFGLHPASSFWSNFERMDGYVSLVHSFLYMLVLGSVLQTQEHWKYFLNTTLGVAFGVALYGLAQYGGMVDGSSRIDSRLGNAAYMAIYMFFHIFIALWLLVKAKGNLMLQLMYAAMIALFVFVLFETGTRGTVLGLAAGIFATSAYIGFFGAEFKQYRKYAIGGFIVLLIGVGAFIAGRDSDFIQNNDNLARVANISLEDLEIRGIIWGMAWEGVQERPLLGYGQSNFNYVFNENYDPRLYAQEQWFDRAHNIFMDWLIAGGFLGLIAYLSIFGWCVWYLFVRPLMKPEDTSFTVVERGILIGMLAGYFTHNLVVFDNIVSYIFFAVILGLITSRVGAIPQRVADAKIDQQLIQQIVAPVMIVLLVAVIWFVHRPGMLAAQDIIDAFRAQNPEVQLAEFQTALERDSIGQQEIVEQLAQQAMNLAQQQQVPQETRTEFLEVAEAELLQLIEDKPNDARIHVFAGSFYRSMGDLEAAAEQLAVARELSPNKQSIIQQQGFVELAQGDYEEAQAFFKAAYELDTRNTAAKEYYVGSLLYNGQTEEARALLYEDNMLSQMIDSDYLLAAANDNNLTELMIDIFELRLSTSTTEAQQQKWRNQAQTWASLAFLYYQVGSSTAAIATLEEARQVVPSFATTAQCFIGNIEAGNEPNEGCQ